MNDWDRADGGWATGEALTERVFHDLRPNYGPTRAVIQQLPTALLGAWGSLEQRRSELR